VLHDGALLELNRDPFAMLSREQAMEIYDCNRTEAEASDATRGKSIGRDQVAGNSPGVGKDDVKWLQAKERPSCSTRG
jgi:hypothetical protein